MGNDKCFCHLNGFAVKDATARQEIEIVKETIKNISTNTKPGEDGKDGVTFTPSVDDDGNLSWSNDGGLENPATINIKGKDGVDGVDGEDGKDGVTFTPSVDDDGNLSWSNDGGLENPATINIKGSGGEGSGGAVYMTQLLFDRTDSKFHGCFYFFTSTAINELYDTDATSILTKLTGLKTSNTPIIGSVVQYDGNNKPTQNFHLRSISSITVSSGVDFTAWAGSSSLSNYLKTSNTSFMLFASVVVA